MQQNKLASPTHSGSKASEVEKKMLLRRISEMSTLPTPSVSMMKVMLLLRDEDVRIAELVTAIEKDQSWSPRS
jgi:HD-like signal output (HDOD) protein